MSIGTNTQMRENGEIGTGGTAANDGHKRQGDRQLPVNRIFPRDAELNVDDADRRGLENDLSAKIRVIRVPFFLYAIIPGPIGRNRAACHNET